ncbi:hypothetical protein SDC9_156836 [bioreactor metagenome]|uniref:PhoU domain-containing protein n=1 Tax=bioreactor metagenome TaxID=1076179 RepID=A0A645F5B7_9ZZZZ
MLVSAVKEIMELTTGSFEREDAKSAGKVEPLEQVVDLLRDELKSRHIARLRDGNCTIELGFMFADLLSNCERVSDHCSNIAVCTIQLHEDSFDTHDYLNTLKKEPDGAFAREYESYKDKFRLPA